MTQAIIETVPRVNLNKGDKFNLTPLIMACRNGHANVVGLLLKHHAQADVSDTSGNSALHYAAAYGWQDCVKVLLKYSLNHEEE